MGVCYSIKNNNILKNHSKNNNCYRKEISSLNGNLSTDLMLNKISFDEDEKVISEIGIYLFEKVFVI